MKRRITRQRSRGQALTEFSLVLPILLILFLGIIEFGRFVLAYQVLNNAVREGSRYAVVHGSNSTCPSGPMPGGVTSPSPCADPTGSAVKSKVVSMGYTLRLKSSDISVDWPGLDNARGENVTVTADYTFTTIVPLPLPGIPMKAESTLVINH
jgi:hypothetical protein